MVKPGPYFHRTGTPGEFLCHRIRVTREALEILFLSASHPSMVSLYLAEYQNAVGFVTAPRDTCHSGTEASSATVPGLVCGHPYGPLAPIFGGDFRGTTDGNEIDGHRDSH